VTDAVPSAEILAASRNHLNRRVAGMQKLMGANAHAVSAAGAEVLLSDGRRVIDLGTWASSILGHCPPAVVAAVTEQCGTLPAAVRGLASQPAPLLARRLVELASPSRLTRVWLGANGADVTEAALKLARVTTGRLKVLAVRGGFHGRTLGALAVSDADRYSADLQPLLPEVVKIDPEPTAVARHVAAGDVAAVIFEIIQGGRGVVPLPVEVLDGWIRAAHEAGALVIVDEIQTGLWRCGSFSLSLALGLDPDAVLLGKTLGGGVMPLSALLCTQPMAAALEENPFLHSQTFSGHPLACAAGLAALAAIPAAAAANTDRVAMWLGSLRERLARHGDLISRVDVYGLMMGIEFRSPGLADQFVIAAARAGVLLAPSDGDRSVIRVLPALVMSTAQMSLAADRLDGVCDARQRWQAPSTRAPSVRAPSVRAPST
jgi:putrescine aminotransferase